MYIAFQLTVYYLAMHKMTGNRHKTNFPLFKNFKTTDDPDLVKGILFRSARLTTLNVVGVLLLFITNNFLVKLLGEEVYETTLLSMCGFSFFLSLLYSAWMISLLPPCLNIILMT
jgi:hypothetical protein